MMVLHDGEGSPQDIVTIQYDDDVVIMSVDIFIYQWMTWFTTHNAPREPNYP